MVGLEVTAGALEEGAAVPVVGNFVGDDVSSAGPNGASVAAHNETPESVKMHGVGTL